VATLVDGVSKVASIRWEHDIEEQFAENLRKMVLFMAEDIRVVIVKLADRLHNMRTLWAVKPEKQERIARETLEIYAPLAERLGMGEVSGELSDLAFEYSYPKQYKEILRDSKPYYKTAQSHIKKMRHVLLRRLTEAGINADVQGREKRLYSLWRKLERKNLGKDFEQIHDIVALRVLVDTVSECYTALGTVHAYFKHAPSLGVSDFIAQPKPNGYQSIHTKVFGPGGRIVEVQIRTREMHELAEYGVAAHWAYSQAKSRGVPDEVLEKQGVEAKGKKLDWVKQLVEWQKELTDSKEYLQAVKFDAFRERNFVFSPKGDVFDLPAGATPVDFAFAVHTDLADFIQGAKVNGKIVPLNYKLQGGDVVEILKSKNKKLLNRDWLGFVVTTAAKREINKQLRKEK
jgi:GTP pyrophosphokinase